MPFTSSGKIDRKSLPKPILEVSGVNLPETHLEEVLLDIWGQILKLDKQFIDIDRSFFDLGGHSLRAVLLINRIHKDLSVDLPLRVIFQHQDIRSLAGYIEGQDQVAYLSIPKARVQDYYPLSSAQRRLYFLYEYDKASVSYNMPQFVRLRGPLDIARLEASFVNLVSRHSILRTSFHMKGEEALQQVHPEVDFKVSYEEVEESEVSSIIQSFIRPFDLSSGCLLRVKLLIIDAMNHLLLVDMHHIVSDGVSSGILVRDLMTYYEGSSLPPLSLDYKDYSVWQQSSSQSALKDAHRSYWHSVYSEEPLVLDLPYDYARPSHAVQEGAVYRFKIDKSLTDSISSIAAGSNTTMFTVLLSAYGILLGRLTNEEDIIIGTPVAGREHSDLEGMIGMFVNTLALRLFPQGIEDFTSYLHGVRDHVLSSFEHQSYPYEELVDDLHLSRNTNRNPLFDVMFSYGNFESESLTMEGIDLESYPTGNTTTKFDLSLSCSEVEGELWLTFEYSTELFKSETIERFSNYFESILRVITAEANISLSAIDILSDRERSTLLSSFNDTWKVYEPGTIIDYFERSALSSGSAVAVYCEGSCMSYDELNTSANRLCYYLTEHCQVGSGDVVGLYFERSASLIVSLLGVLKSGAAFTALSPDYPKERVNQIIKGADIKVVINNTGESFVYGKPELMVVNPLSSLIQDVSLSDNPSVTLSGSDAAYVIYTSGSTGEPKGIIISHSNMVDYVLTFCSYFGLTKEDKVVHQSSLSFDTSIEEIFPALISGSSIVISPVGGKDIISLASLIESREATLLSATPLVLGELNNFREQLHTLRTIISGGELLLPSHIDKLIRQQEIYNTYGPSESTVCITYNKVVDLSDASLIGSPIANRQVYILDKYQQLCPLGVAGELCVSGKGLASGYLNNESLTDAKFIANPFLAGERMYRTGDLARWNSEGKLEFIGRIDNQVKISGFRIELGEIEHCIDNLSEVRDVSVIAYGKENARKLVVFYVSDEEIAAEIFRDHLSSKLPVYMVPHHYIHLDHMPLTVNGKLDKRSLPAPELTSGAYTAPVSSMEHDLVQIWSEVLKQPSESISVTRSFFELGGHSLKAAFLVNRIHKDLSVDLPLRVIFQHQDIRSLAGYIERQDQVRYLSIPKAPVQDYYPLSSAQRRLYFLYEYDKTSVSYNMPQVVRLRGPLDIARLEASFVNLVSRHSILRTSFHMKGEEALQQVHPEVGFKVSYGEVEESEVSSIIQSFIRPFDLSSGCLLRVKLLIIDAMNHLLLVDMHHIVSDGVSSGILVRDLMTYYEGSSLPPLSLDYKDYSVWQQSSSQSALKDAHRSYWHSVYSEEPLVLDLPYDYARPSHAVQEGAVYHFKIDKSLTDSISSIAAGSNTTMFTVLLSAYGILLGRLTNEEDIIIGTPVAGREHSDLEGMIGMFVNTLALRLFPQGIEDFTSYLHGVRDHVLSSFEHQSYPYEELVDDLHLSRNTNRNPLFDVMFSYGNFESESLTMEGIDLESYPTGNTTTKFDLSLSCSEVEGELWLSFSYSSELFKEESIKRFADYYCSILEQIGRDSSISVGAIDILSDQEKQELLVDFNDTAHDYPLEKTIIQVFNEKVEEFSDHVALVFEGKKMTYALLKQKVDSVASYISKVGIGKNELVGVLMDKSFDMIVAVMGVLESGAAFLPIDPGNPSDRIDYMLRDSGCRLLIVQSHLQDRFSVDLEVLKISEIDSNSTCFKNHSSPEDLAYLIYTSGTSGKPKGVAVKHKSLTNLCFWHNETFNISELDRATKYASFSFDASVWEIFPYLIKGASIHIINNSLKLDVKKLNEYYNRNGISISFLPTQVCEEFMKEDNSSLRILLTGGDNLRKMANNRYQIFNNYGPTENTVVSTSGQLEYGGHISIGRPIANSQVYIIDRNGNLVPKGVKGELYVGGANLSEGYWNKLELTKSKFIKIEWCENGKVYKTGDLARWLPDGLLEFKGRVDHQVKIRGFRIELSEIESVCLEYDEVREVVVVVYEQGGDKHLILYYTGFQDVGDNIKNYLSSKLPVYMVPHHYIHLDHMPLTVNGKLDKRSLPAPELTSGAYTAPVSSMEHDLVQIWSEVLKQPSESISVTRSFFELGGHSLKAAFLVNRIHKDLSVDLPLRVIFQHQDIRSLAGYIERQDQVRYLSIPKAPVQDYYPLSSAQRRLYFLYEYDKTSVSYNMPQVVRLRGPLDIARLEASFVNLVSRHSILRTSFHMKGEEALQQVHPEVGFKVSYGEVEESEVSSIIQSFIRPFDLSSGCLLRVKLLIIDAMNHLLLVDMHHIVSDGVSSGILVRDLMTYYEGSSLPPLSLDYKDYSVWQQSSSQSALKDAHRSYWHSVYSEEPLVLDLPYDYARPSHAVQEGAVYHFKIDKSLTDSISSIAAGSNTTMFTVLLSAYGILLGRLTNEEDIIIGTPVAGREHSDLEGMIGMFVNTLALRLFPQGIEDFTSYLHGVRDHVLSSFEHQSYPYEELVDDLHLSRNTNRNPLFDVMFSYGNFESESLTMEGIDLESYPTGNTTTKFDLSLSCSEVEGELWLSFSYSSELFKEESIKRFADYYCSILEQIGRDSSISVGAIDILSDQEKQELLVDFNDTAHAYDQEVTLIDQFRKQVSKTPHAVAMIYHDDEMDYLTLDVYSDRLASFLQSIGVSQGDKVGLMLSRSFQMIIGLLGIMKAGAAYVPMDIEQPTSRKLHIIKECDIEVLITDAGDEVSLPNVKLVRVSDGLNVSVGTKRELRGDHTAYVIYTSGSTGHPKGVMITHRSVINYISCQQENYHLTAGERILQFSSIIFDASVEQIWLSLLSGSSLVLLDKDLLLDRDSLWSYVKAKSVTHFHSTPIFLEGIPVDGCSSLKRVVSGGEECKPSLVNKFIPYCDFYNKYGPTETTISSLLHYIGKDTPQKGSIPIGSPVWNTQLYVLGKHGGLQPKGSTGELYIGGAGLSGGYLNKSSLTSEKFVQNPYESGDIIYKTGDLVRWLPGGQMEFKGRSDDQIKIRGFRVEPGEIENHLRIYADITQVVVLALGDGSDRHLVAYYVSKTEHSSDDLRQYLSEYFPEYMVPLYYVYLEHMPLTINGKLDKRSLPSPELTSGAYTAPASSMEHDLVQIWSEVLKQPSESISVTRSFFELGGHSLKAAFLVNRIHDQLNVEVSLYDVFDKPTIRGLSKRLEQISKPSSAFDNSVISLKTNDQSDLNLFFIHDGGGDVSGYLKLTEQISGCNCWGLKSDTLNSIGPSDTCIEEIADRFMEKILMIQDKGPYYLLGWSFGGTLAVEIARRIEQKGLEVALVTIIDSYLPVTNDGTYVKFDLNEEIKFLKEFVDVKLSNKKETSLEDLWVNALMTIENRSEYLLKVKNQLDNGLKNLMPHWEESNLEELVRGINTIRTLREIKIKYLPDYRIKAQCVYIKANKSEANIDNVQAFFNKNLLVHEIEGDHFNIMRKPKVSMVYEIIENHLKSLRDIFIDELISE
ncbi:amino acid adenylation domain-containing protein [Fulvivirga maritima]|nr:amino acid adenylation domain-containing protein [Fulvivirga maritima]